MTDFQAELAPITPSSSIAECIDALRFPDEFQREALGLIVSRWSDAAQLLLEALQASLAQADDSSHEPDELDEIPFQAAYLFAQFEHKPAYPLLLRLVRHPLAEDLLGDFLLEGFPRCLASCWDGDIQALREVVLDRSANEYARTAAWSAILCLTAWGLRSAEETMADLKELLEKVNVLGSDFLAGGIAMSATQMPADQAVIELARQAFKSKHVDLKTYPVKEFEADLKAFKLESWQDHLGELHGLKVEDAIEEIELWFDDADDESGEEEWAPSEPVEQLVSTKIDRNDPCPCKSGMKYKKCCGKNA